MKSINPTKSQKSSKAAGTVSNRNLVAWTSLMMAVLTCAVFVPSLWNGFVDWDDDKTLTGNPYYRGLGWSQLRWMFTTFHTGHYQPLSWITFALDYLVWGTDPFGYHLTSLILHSANAGLFYLICRHLLLIVFAPTAALQGLGLNLAAGLGALLFAVHPLRVESVVWATERRDVLSGLFFLACIEFYLRAYESRQDQRGQRLWLTAAVIAHALSLLSKATAITLPVVLLILDIYPLRRLPVKFSTWFKPPARHILREKLSFLILAVIFGLIAVAAQHETGALRQVQQYFFSYRVAQAFYGVSFYVWKTVLPVRLSPLYELPYDFEAWMPLFFVSAAAVTLLSIAIYVMRQRWPALLACWAYYIVVVAPVLGLAQSGPQLVADRYSYLSCLSWAVLAGGVFLNAWQASYRHESRRIPSVVLAALSLVVVSTLGIMTWKQTAAWHDPKTLWQHALQVAPETSIAHYNLGRTYESEGNTLVAQELYRKALIINPSYSDARYNLARLLARDGNQAEAIDHYREALRFNPNDAEARNNLGLLLAMRGDPKAALDEFRKAIEYDRKYAPAYFNLGRVLASQGDLLNAELNYRKALVLDPHRAEIYVGLATVLARQGDLGSATKYFREAIQLKPDFAEAHTALARLLVAQGRTDEAEQSYREALRLLKNQSLSSSEEQTVK